MSKFSIIANKYLEINNPISKEKINTLINLLDLKKDDQVIDIGAGKGLILKSIIDKYDAKGFLIEMHHGLFDDIKNNFKDYNKNVSIELKPYQQFIEENSEKLFDCIVCIGSNQAVSKDFEDSIKKMSEKLNKGGKLLLGQGYWKKTPDKDYLESTGISEDEMLSHYQNIETAGKYNLSHLYSLTASQDEWDNFEGLFNKAVKDYCFDNPEDPENITYLQRIENWNRNYLKYGRDTMGFALYLFRKL